MIIAYNTFFLCCSSNDTGINMPRFDKEIEIRQELVVILGRTINAGSHKNRWKAV
jgi:hypothetical protein